MALSEVEVEVALRALERTGARGLRVAEGSRMIPCGCWEHPVAHVPEAAPGSAWRVVWRCTGCGHLKG